MPEEMSGFSPRLIVLSLALSFYVLDDTAFIPDVVRGCIYRREFMAEQSDYDSSDEIEESKFVDPKYLDILREAGLFVSPPRSLFDGEWYWIVKPTTASGNSVAGRSSGFISFYKDIQCPDTDAPMLKLCYGSGKWQVDGISHAGGMGPGDFVTYWGNPEDALDDILDFYFGDPRRMNLKNRTMRFEEAASAE